MLNHFTCQSGPFKTPYFSSRFKKFHRIERENEKVTWHISRKNAVFTHSDCKEECVLKPTYVQFLFILLRTCIFGTSLESLNVEKRRVKFASDHDMKCCTGSLDFFIWLLFLILWLFCVRTCREASASLVRLVY